MERGPRYSYPHGQAAILRPWCSRSRQNGNMKAAVPSKTSVVVSAASLNTHRAMWADLSLEKVHAGEVPHIWASVFEKKHI